METRQIPPIFPSTFSTLTACNIFAFETSQNSFSYGPPFGPFWSVKYLNFRKKLPIQTIHLTFLENRHLEVTENPNYVYIYKGNSKYRSAKQIYGLVHV